MGLWLLLYAVLLLCVFRSYFLSYPLPEFISKITALVGCLFLLLACFSTGQLVTDYLFMSLNDHEMGLHSSPLRVLINGAVGFGIAGTVVLISGWLLPGPLKIKLTVLTVAFSLLILRTLYQHRLPTFSLHRFQWSSGEMLGLALALGGMAVTFLGCFSPITYYDSLVYHLALPNLYNQMGKISAVPFNLYSCFPANTEMLYLYILNQLPQAEYTINLLGWSTSLAVSLGIAQWAFEWGGKKQAVWAFALWWSCPAVLLLSIGAYVDITLACFIFFSIRSFCIAQQQKWDPRWISLSGFLFGVAFSTKYTGAVCGILLFLFLLHAILIKREAPYSRLIIFAATSLIPSFFWLLKNTITIGNPVFPFLYKWLGGNVGWTQSTADGYFALLVEYGAKSHILYELLLAPWKVATSAASFGGGFDVLGDFGWPLFIFSAPLAFLLNKKHTPTRLLSFYGLCHFIFWFTTKPVLRFLIGMLPIAVILSSSVLHHLTTNKTPRPKALPFFLIAPWILSNFFMYFLVVSELQIFSVALGLETRETYLNRRLTFHPVFSYVNTHLSLNDKLLILGEQRTYHLQRSFIGSNLFAPSPIAKICNSGSETDGILHHFKENHLTHTLINEGEISRLGGLEKFGFDQIGKISLGDFLSKNCQLIYENHHVKLYRLLIS